MTIVLLRVYLIGKSAVWICARRLYFVTVDGGIDDAPNYRILRVCHVTSCPVNTSPCTFTALYEQAIRCGNRFGGGSEEQSCGLSLVEDFSGVSGPSMIVSRCHLDRSSDNIVCSYDLTAIDSNMDIRYDRCSMSIGESRLAWAHGFSCRSSAVSFFVVFVSSSGASCEAYHFHYTYKLYTYIHTMLKPSFIDSIMYYVVKF